MGLEIDHPAGVALLAATVGRFPTVDGLADVTPTDGAGTTAVVAFTGHAFVLTDRAESEVRDFEPDGFGAALAPRLLLALAAPDLVIGSIDVVLVRAALGGGSDLAPRPDLDAHPRAVRSREHRRDVRVIGDDAGLVTIGRGLLDRTEVSVELTGAAHGRGHGRRLLMSALRAIPEGEPVFAQVAAGNSASLRAFLACGFVPICSEVIISPHAD